MQTYWEESAGNSDMTLIENDGVEENRYEEGKQGDSEQESKHVDRRMEGEGWRTKQTYCILITLSEMDAV